MEVGEGKKLNGTLKNLFYRMAMRDRRMRDRAEGEARGHGISYV